MYNKLRKIMDQLIQKLKLENQWISLFQSFNRRNNLTNNSVSRLQEVNIQSLMKHLAKMQINLYIRSEENDQKHKISWVSSQYQALEIVLNSLSVIAQKVIQDFVKFLFIQTISEWTQVYNIFPYKLPLTIKYESLRIVQEKKQARRRWCASEQNFLIEIVKQFFNLFARSCKKNKWNDVARQLFIKSEGQFFRQGKHCRERWLNHLHPAIQKQFFIQNSNQWSLEEDTRLLSFVLKKGKKWARIAKKFDMKRSQCMVKKRFYELINIEEQESLSNQALRNCIKIKFDELKALMGPQLEEIKQMDKYQFDVDKKQRKCSISKETLKTDVNERLCLPEHKIKEEQRMEEVQEGRNCQGLNFYAGTGFNGPQGYFNGQMINGSLVPDQYNYYMHYMGLMSGLMGPMYGHYPSVIVPIQNNIIINQGIHNQPQFQEF